MFIMNKPGCTDAERQWAKEISSHAEYLCELASVLISSAKNADTEECKYHLMDIEQAVDDLKKKIEGEEL